MIGELLGEAVGWVVGEICGGVLELIWPKRVSGRAVIVAWLVLGGAAWGVTRWWQADPASGGRTQLAWLTWIFLPVIGIALTLSYDGSLQERKRLRREVAGQGVLRNDRLRAARGRGG